MSVIDMLFDGAVASVSATLVSNPFDVIRTRMQLQGELRKPGEYRIMYRSLSRSFIRIAREEGVHALYNGLAPAVLWQITMNGVRFGLYPVLKSNLEYHTGTSSIFVSVTAGATCGAIGAYISSPFNMVKTRLQAQNRAKLSLNSEHASAHMNIPAGRNPVYSGVADALSGIYREGGIKRLWYGSVISCQRTMVGSATQLVTYDAVKKWACAYSNLPASDWRIHLLSAVTAAMAVVVMINPLDVVMTRAYSQNLDQLNKYSNNLLLDTLKIYRIEGLAGLYKGSLPLFAHFLPHTLVTFLVMEQVRRMRERMNARSASPKRDADGQLSFAQFMTINLTLDKRFAEELGYLYYNY